MDSPVTENLFGDDLETKVDDIEKQERRTNKLTGTKSSTPFLYQKPAPRGRGSYSQNWQPKQRYNQIYRYMCVYCICNLLIKR